MFVRRGGFYFCPVPKGDQADPLPSLVTTYLWNELMKNWVEKHGTPEMQRAVSEGYSVTSSAIGDLLLSELQDSLEMPVAFEWVEVRERKDPQAASFGRRDVVQVCAKGIETPDGYTVEVSRISRVEERESKPRKYWTGVVVSVHYEGRIVSEAAVNFED